MWGPIVLPGGERLIDGKGSVYRSGFVPVDAELETSLKYLYDKYRDGASSPDVAYWLSAGYLSTGQIDAARDVCSGARQTHPDDLPRFIDFDMQFHRTVVCMSGNKVLLAAFDATEYRRALNRYAGHSWSVLETATN